jgi:predicted acyl esterase
MKRLLALLLVVFAFCGHLLADDAVNAKLLALFQQSDTNHDGTLSPEEQARAVESVKKIYGDQWAQQVQKMFAHAAAASDQSVSADSWRAEVARFGRSTAATPAVQTVQIPMRDGKKLATDITMPRGEGPFPALLTRTPYGRAKAKGAGAGYAANGVVFVCQDMRGRFDSEGENLPFVGCGWNEHQDGVDTIAWLRQQPWCNGAIGTVGGSAGGITQNLLAGAAPEGLKAQYITVAAASLYSDATYIGGAFRKADTENWLTSNGFDPRALIDGRAHPSYDDYWKPFDTRQKFGVMNVPAVHVGGWFDMFEQATLDEFVGRQESGGSGSRGTQKVVIGPWTHGIGKMPVGELTFSNSKPPPQYQDARWFDHYLRGTNNGVEKEPAVAYYVLGDTSVSGAPGNEWRYAERWPIPATEAGWYFARDGKLSTAQPAETGDTSVDYTFDPAKPCPTIGGNNLTLDRGPMNQNKIENRSDVVLFTTAPLDAPLEVTGPVKAKVFVSSSAADTDLSVRLCDVYPDGKSYLIAEGILRLRYRNSFEKPEPLTPGRIEEVTVNCWSTSIIFNKGHRIRATVTSSNYPRFDVNPGTGEPWSSDRVQVVQTNRIYCDAAHPSHLVLPVVGR